MKIWRLLLLPGVVLVLSGCGSMLGRMTQQGKPYPGLRFCAESMDRPFEGGDVVVWLDSPLSFALDTVMIPFDLLDNTGHDESIRPMSTKGAGTAQP